MHVIIVGAGLGGIANAIELERHGFRELTVLERADGIGGTWRQNTYPGAACDVPSHLYSYSFATRRDWTRVCSPQPEILRYVEEVAREHGVDRLVRTGVDVTACAWSDGGWTVRSADGRTWRADALVLATGQLHQPAYLRLGGSFAGHSFHSARWDHRYDLRGKRVAVIGTGASAVQLVPAVARQAAELVVFQRTPNWFLPRRNRVYPRPLRALIRFVPGLQALRRRFYALLVELLTIAIRHPRTVGRLCAALSVTFMRAQVRDPELWRKVRPDYTFGCKRVLFSSDFLPTLRRRNVELVTEPIARLTAGGIVTADGREREVDCIIYGTGFRATRFMAPMEVRGADGRTLAEAWAGGAHAHLGLTVPGFPNLFLIYGPNTNSSGGSIITYEEAQAAYVRQALELVRARRATALDVRADVEAASDRALQARFAGTAWTRCDSWYRDEGGRIVTNWPGYMREYERRVARLEPADFTLL